MGLMTVLGTIGVAVIGGLLKAEAEAWAPRAAFHLARISANLAPTNDRERLNEEWAAYLIDVPGPLTKIGASFGFMWTSISLSASYSTARYTRITYLRLLVFTLGLSAQLNHRAANAFERYSLRGRADMPDWMTWVVYEAPAIAIHNTASAWSHIGYKRGYIPKPFPPA